MGRVLTWGLGALLIVAAVACSPFGGGAFTCTDDNQCGAAGQCELNGFCSFPDAQCGSGRRYGEASGSLAGVCVGDEPDAAVDRIDSPPGTIDAGLFDASCVVDGIDLCAHGAPDAAITFGTETFDTDTDHRCRALPQAGGTDGCLVLATAITVSAGATLTGVGSRPLVLAATGVIQLDGVIDVGSTTAGRRGPNADFAGCPAQPVAPTDDPGGAGGGAGGSFAGNGGDGGLGDSDNSLPPGAGTGPGGTHAAAVTAPGFVRGGCRGQIGAKENAAGGQGGASGAGAGTVWLVSSVEVRVTAAGAVRATGAGGSGGQTQAGGGGGGSGGMVRIGAATITIAGQLSANGGGGGGGGGRLNGTNVSGGDGSDGALGSTRAPGGIGASVGGVEVGGRGGAGGALGAVDGAAGGSSIVGGAGAGGGVGFIVLTGAASITGVVSPTPLVN